MPAPPYRETTLYWASTSAGLNGTQVGGIYNTSQADTTNTTQVLAQGTSTRIVKPGTAGVGADPMLFQGFGFGIPLANFLPTDTRGRAFIPAGGSIVYSASVTAANSGITLGSATITPAMSLWKYNTTSKTGTLVAKGTSGTVTFSALALTQTVTCQVNITSDVVFERDEVFYFQVGGSYVAPSGTLGSNTTTWTYTLGSSTLTLSNGLRVLFNESALERASGVARQAKSVIKLLEGMANGTGIASRSLDLKRSFAGSVSGTARTAKSLTLTHSSKAVGNPVNGPDLITKKVMSVVARGTGVRTQTTKKSFSSTSHGNAAFSRSWMAYRNFLAVGEGYAPPVVKHVIFVRYFRAVGVMLIRPRIDLDWKNLPNPGGTPDYPVTTGTKSISGVVYHHETGFVVPGASVYLYREFDRTVVQVGTAAGDGSYSWVRDASDPYLYRVIAIYDDGTGPVQGITQAEAPS